ALKIYRGDDKAFLEEIGNFVQLTKRLNIPYVVKPLDYGSNPKPYVVMEYYPMTLRTLIRNNIELKKKLKIMYRLVKALSYAHQQGIYHGDLKPENILVKEENGEYYPAIADWGGGYTLGYSAPEVVKSGGKILNSKSDVYSLGVILYELLTGQKLFKDLLDYLERAENVKVTLQDKELEDLINASLSKPEYRLSIDEFKDRLGKYLVEVIGTRYSSSLRSKDALEVINMYIDYGDLEKAKSRILIAEKHNLVPGKILLVYHKIVELMDFLNEYKGRTIPVGRLEVKYKGLLDHVSQINPDIVMKIKEDKYSLEQFISMNQDIPPALYDEVYLCTLRLIDIVFAGLNSLLS
ncbi:MAG: serine/threonine-protein kinase, partial [Zestosphaera sp.]